MPSSHRFWQPFRFGGRHRIIDDRRQLVPMCHLEDLSPEADPKLRNLVKHANAHRFSSILKAAVLTAFGWAALSWVLNLAGCRGSNPPGFPPRPPQSFTNAIEVAALLVAINCLLFLVLTSLHARRRGIAAIRALHAAGLCPSCAYDLRDVAPVQDGCTTCPECGAAWRHTARTAISDASIPSAAAPTPPTASHPPAPFR